MSHSTSENFPCSASPVQQAQTLEQSLLTQELQPWPDDSFHYLFKLESIPEDHIGYNPSGFHEILIPGTNKSVMAGYVRVEPNKHDGTETHLGKTQSILYYIDADSGASLSLKPFWELAHEDELADSTNEQKTTLKQRYEIYGEDPSMQQIQIIDQTGEPKMQWLVSSVKVTTHQQALEAYKSRMHDSSPTSLQEYRQLRKAALENPNDINRFETVFYLSDNLQNIKEHEIARGPKGMKDLRIVQYLDEPSGYGVYGRPQGNDTSELGNVTYTRIETLDELNDQSLHDELNDKANLIDENLFEPGEWGGVNDVIRIDETHNLLLVHRACKTGEGGKGRLYEAELFVHDITTNQLTPIAVVGQAESFEELSGDIAVKDNAEVNLKTVVFPGGFMNGQVDFDAENLTIIFTAGVADANTGIVRYTLTEQQRKALKSACSTPVLAA